MSTIIGALGYYSASSIKQAGLLVSETFDKSLMSINYARAAAADFGRMEAALARRWATTAEPGTQEALDRCIEALAASMDEDLTIASERSQSVRAARAAANVRQASAAWNEDRQRLLAEGHPSPQTWTTLDRHAAVVNKQIELLINYIAGDGFTYRQHARAVVARDRDINLLSIGLALMMSAFVAWSLARRITRPVAAASAIAARIARGELDGEFPRGPHDELGALLLAMQAMRDNIRAMMAREVMQRRSAQARLADALEASQEGVIVVDAEGCIALANTQARGYFGDDRRLVQPGATFAALSATDLTRDEAELLQRLASTAHDAGEVKLSDGRWLRIGRNDTQDGGFVAVLSDITALKDRTASLQLANGTLDAALDHMSQGLCLFDAQDRLRVVNRRFCEIYRLSPEVVKPGLSFTEVVTLSVAAGNYPGRTVAELLAARDASLSRPTEASLHELGEDRFVAVSRQVMPDGGTVTTYEDVSERKRAEAQVVFLARHDALTSLPNRTLFAERVEEAFADAGQNQNSFAVLALDLDRFKAVNDTLGHFIGDELLQIVARRLSDCVREGDTVARLGGDEFAIIQTPLHHREDVAMLTQRVIDVLSAPFEIDGNQIVIGASVGVSFAPQDGDTCAKLLRNADVALYRAKADGRGRWRAFDPEMDRRLQSRRAMELDLRAALADGQFELYYQPQFDLEQQRISGFEALLRWNHPTRGQVSPNDFVSLAEEMGLIVPMGEWVLRQACIEACKWPAHVKVAVNVSPAQFKNHDLLETVRQALAYSGLPAARLELEITETVLLNDSAATLAILHGLRNDLGLRIAMDDFGTGYSSLSYLRSFPFDKVKIDQSFIRDLTTRDGATEIVRAITGLCGNLGIRTTAEGVETKQQLAWLKAEGCSEVQGYLISTPCPASTIDALLKSNDFARNAA